MFFFLQQLSVRSITAPSLCHCNVHGFPGKHNSSRWPLAIAQRDRKKNKNAPNLTLKAKLLHVEPSPLPFGGDFLSLSRLGSGAASSLDSHRAPGGGTAPPEGSAPALNQHFQTVLKGTERLLQLLLVCCQCCGNVSTSGMGASPCHSPAPLAREKIMVRQKPGCHLPLHPPPEFSLLNSPLMCLVCTAAKPCVMFTPFVL